MSNIRESNIELILQRENHASTNLQLDDLDGLPDPEVVHDDADYHGSKLLTRCLFEWKQSEDEVGSLGSMLPACGYVLVQVLQLTLDGENPTGEIYVLDSGDEVQDTAPLNISINNSMLADGEIKKIK